MHDIYRLELLHVLIKRHHSTTSRTINYKYCTYAGPHGAMAMSDSVILERITQRKSVHRALIVREQRDPSGARLQPHMDSYPSTLTTRLRRRG